LKKPKTVIIKVTDEKNLDRLRGTRMREPAKKNSVVPIGKPSRAEDKAADRLAGYLNEHMRSHRAEARGSLVYSIPPEILASLGSTNRKVWEPTRGHGAYQVDNLICKKSGPAVVAIEIKLGKFSTHDVLTYSAKALQHKRYSPHLRYGFVIPGRKKLDNKFFQHSQGFDFALAFLENPAGRAEFVRLVKRQIKAANELLRIANGQRTKPISKFETLVRVP
jgi:hypothetical protein